MTPLLPLLLYIAIVVEIAYVVKGNPTVVVIFEAFMNASVGLIKVSVVVVLLQDGGWLKWKIKIGFNH